MKYLWLIILIGATPSVGAKTLCGLDVGFEKAAAQLNILLQNEAVAGRGVSLELAHSSNGATPDSVCASFNPGSRKMRVVCASDVNPAVATSTLNQRLVGAFVFATAQVAPSGGGGLASACAAASFESLLPSSP